MAFPYERFRIPSQQSRMLKIDHSYGSTEPSPFGRGPTYEDPRAYLAELKALGYGGVVTNVGMTDEYLESEAQWAQFRERIQILNESGMRLWIYDEKGYPSGMAGGKVFRDHPEWEAIALVSQCIHIRGERMTPTLQAPKGCTLVSAAAYRGTCEDDICLDTYVDLTGEVSENGSLRWAIPDGDWMVFAFYTRVIYEYCVPEQRRGDGVRRGANLMERPAGDYFVEITHQRYYEKAGDLLDGKLEAFFADEPSFMTYTFSEDAYVADDMMDRYAPEIREIPRLAPIPWKWDLLDCFTARFGYDLTPYLPYLFGGSCKDAVKVRRDYYVLCSELAANGFFGACSDFCAAHGIDLSGHLLLEEDIKESAITQGDFFAQMSRMQRPGIDMITGEPKLCRVEALAGKLASSVAHLNGKNHVFVEISNFKEHLKHPVPAFHWQKALNVLQLLAAQNVDTFASYYGADFAGEHTPALLTGMARLSELLGDTTHQADVALFYPIESIFGYTTPSSRGIFVRPYLGELQAYSDSFHQTFDALLDAQLDMDLINDEFLLQSSVEDGLLCVPGGEQFRVLVLPKVAIMRAALAEKLVSFAQSGLPIILLGDTDPMALKSEKDWQLHEAYETLRKHAYACAAPANVPGVIRGLIQADITLFTPCAELNVCHRRGEGYDAWLLVNFGETDRDISGVVRAAGKVTLLDPMTAESVDGKAEAFGEMTAFSTHIPGYSTVILVVET